MFLTPVHVQHIKSVLLQGRQTLAVTGSFFLSARGDRQAGEVGAGKVLFVPPAPGTRGARGLLRPAPRIHILDDASGQANMGELVGVLGPSGAAL